MDSTAQNYVPSHTNLLVTYIILMESRPPALTKVRALLMEPPSSQPTQPT